MTAVVAFRFDPKKVHVADNICYSHKLLFTMVVVFVSVMFVESVNLLNMRETR